MGEIKGLRYLFFLVLLGWSLGGCFPYGKLAEGQTRLKKNEIILNETKLSRKEKKRLKTGLAGNYQQVPNEDFLEIHLDTRLYYVTDEPGDTSKFKNFLRKSVVERPSIYNKESSKSTAQTMTFYLQNKGYKDATVRDTSFTKKKKTTARYIATPGVQYLIDSVYFNSPDSAIQILLNDLAATTELVPGRPVSDAIFNAESKRITDALQNRGYAYFEANYIKPRGLPRGNRVVVYYDVLAPPKTNFHQKYHIGTVYVDPYYVKAGSLVRERDTVEVEKGVYFIFDKNMPRKIKAENILKSTFLRPGDIYQENNFLKSVQQLRNLAIIKDVNIIEKIDDENPDVLNFEVFLFPNKQMSIGGDLELNNSTFSVENEDANLIGISTSATYRNRNLFKNAALFTTRARLGFEFDIANTNDTLLYSREVSLLNDLYFPRFVDIFRIWKGLNAINIVSDKFYNNIKDKTKSRLSLNYENLSLFRYYDSNSFNTTYGYDFQPNQRQRVQLTQVGINLYLINKKPALIDIEANNPFLQRSFDDQLLTGFIFRDLTYTDQGKITNNNTSYYFRGNIELSGGEVSFVNWLSNKISGNNKTFSFLDDVEYAQYVRMEADVRWFKYFNNNQSLALRLNTGVAFNYGFSDEIPYLKQFFLGGPNSVRAWRIRELGPGEYADPLTINPIPDARLVPFFQSGDFALEMSAEYRFNLLQIYGYTIESAFFVDAGNVWTINYDENRKGSQLSWKPRPDPVDPTNMIGRNFLKQIAVGAGTGLRLDFSYFVLRFDAAIKLRNPFPDPDNNDNFWINRDWGKLQFRDFNYNLAVGYPF